MASGSDGVCGLDTKNFLPSRLLLQVQMPHTSQKLFQLVTQDTFYKWGAKSPALSHMARSEIRSTLLECFGGYVSKLTLHRISEHPLNRAKAGEGRFQLLHAPKGGQSRASLVT